jgi:uncharacterized protein (DUF488 family)
MKQYELLTIGYEGREIDEFVLRLKSFNVTHLIDVREIPLSRKKGFSKSTLGQRLQDVNIEYVHAKPLGSPAAIRNKLKSDWDYKSFFKAYSEYLSRNMDAVEKVHQYLFDGVTCIMCFERFPEKCHRSIVADKIKEYDGNGLKIKHI